MKSKSGACPRCRKEIPLVPDSQGDLVLEVHHVVAVERAYGMADVVQECPGTGGEAASLDDTSDWSWVTRNRQWIRDDSDLRRPIRLTDAISGLAPVAATGDVTTAMREFSALWAAGEYAADDEAPCPAWVGMCRCVKAPCDGAHRCRCGHSWAAREYAG